MFRARIAFASRLAARRDPAVAAVRSVSEVGEGAIAILLRTPYSRRVPELPGIARAPSRKSTAVLWSRVRATRKAACLNAGRLFGPGHRIRAAVDGSGFRNAPPKAETVEAWRMIIKNKKVTGR